MVNGTTPSRAEPSYWNGTVPWLSSGKVNDYLVVEPSEYITIDALKKTSLNLIPRNSLVMGMIGQGKTRGMTAKLGIEATINQNLAAIIPSTAVIADFLHYFFQAAYKYLREDGRGGNQEAMNCSMISALSVPVPPLKEQERIVNFLNIQKEQFDNTVNKANQEINLINEYRTTLISEVVTGKIDVRTAA